MIESIAAMLPLGCSIGIVPLAAVLWGKRGQLRRRYCVPVALPLLDIERRDYGVRMTLSMGGVFHAVIAALIVDLGFTAAGIVPRGTGGIEARVSHFEANHTVRLNGRY